RSEFSGTGDWYDWVGPEFTCRACFQPALLNRAGLCDRCRQHSSKQPCRICGKNPMKSRIHGRCDACQNYYERHGRERSEFLTKSAKDEKFLAERERVAELPQWAQEAAEARNRRELPRDPAAFE